MFEDLSAARMVALDLETYDPNLLEQGPGSFRNDGFVAGISIKPIDGPSQYYPIAHTTGNLPLGQVVKYLKDQLSSDIPKLGANILYDLEWLRWQGVKVGGKKYDIQVAEPLLDENRFQYNLEDISQRRLGVGKYKDQLLLEAQRIDPKIKKMSQVFKVLYKMPPEKVSVYACQDTDLLFPIFEQQLKEMREQELMEVFNLETDLIDLLLEMRIQGVPVDLNRAEQVREELLINEKELKKQLAYMAGFDVEIYAAENIAKAFDSLQIKYPLTAKTHKPSFTAPWLESHESEFARLLVKTRKVTKMRSDFVEGMILKSHVHGRIHAQFSPLKNDEGGTVSGRFSSSHPNLQQVPARDPVYGPLIRSMFVPDQGLMWGKHDYSQQEPRLTVHYAFLKGFLGADIAVRKFVENPDTDYHQLVADMCQTDRRTAKNINLGLAYGMGVAKMAVQLGKSEAETRVLFKQYHAGVPFVKLLSENCMQVAQTRGYIKTVMGRRRRFDLWGPMEYRKDNPAMPLRYDEAVKQYGLPVHRAFVHKAANALIQGSAADMIKKAMLDMYHTGYIPYLTVHDENDTGIETKKQLDEISDIMNNAIKLVVPLKVEAFMEKSWGDCK